MPKVTIQLEDRELNTLADLIRAGLNEGQDALGAFEARSMVRLALAIDQLGRGKAFAGRWRILDGAPKWIYAYLARPLFPDGMATAAPAKPKPATRPKPAAPKPAHTRKPLPKMKPAAPNPEDE